ncbi:MAG: cytochrome c biogenesis protein [Planctomycetota bacterium]|nr:cytochrome c biogenesis protein CcsA [Planctomycetaceae bacterium]MDQ3332654.1 cytochrome c biogenesis protein [Planctomycetota bacterium]
MSDVTVFCFFASYLLALAFEVVRAMRGLSWLRWLALPSAAAGLVAHTLFLWERGRATNLPPLLSSTQDWLLVVAWVACVLYLFVVAYDQKAGIGLFALPAVLLLVSVSYFASDSPSAVMRGGNGTPEDRALHGWLMLHAALLGLGIAAVVAGIVSSLMYLVQHRRLRHKQARPAGMKLISLERLERWNRLSVLVAVPLLSLGFGVGFLLFYLAGRQGEQTSLWDPVVIASSLAWVVMVAVLGRTMRSEHPAGKSVALRTLIAFGFLLATMLGLQLATGGGGHAVKDWQGRKVELDRAGKGETADP